MTSRGTLRPEDPDGFSAQEERKLLACCPGVSVEPRTGSGLPCDEIWGTYSSMRYGWAGDEKIRHRGATAGVLSALGAFLLQTARAAFIIHVGADPEQPMRSRWFFSEDPASVISRAGSRYGPSAPLAGLVAALEREQSFAIIAKPCDFNAINRYAQIDTRLEDLCVARLSLICGGQPRLSKSQGLLRECGVEEGDVTLFRYRGHGNPGLTRIETDSGEVIEKTYNELWEDESTWDIETRCKLCPDALGEAADIAVGDVWPGGCPTGEDEGFSGIVVRSHVGQAVLEAAVAAGAVVLGDEILPRQFDGFQPHQVRKKMALATRFRALQAAGRPRIEAGGLRLDILTKRLDETAAEEEYSETLRRLRDGRIAEPPE